MNKNDSFEFVKTDKATSPGGHYSQAVKYGDFIFVSGQLGFQPGSSDPVVVSIEEQTRNCLLNIEQILLAADSSLRSVLKTTVYISNVELWPTVNAIYADIFQDHEPARAIVPCNKLHYGFDVEIEAIAACNKPSI